MKSDYYAIVITTTDTNENARKITETLLSKQLVACVQTSTISSAYRWQEKIVSSEEIRLEMKTKSALFHLIKKEIETLHTYEVPEIILIPIKNANHAYLEWIDKETC